MYDNRRKKLLCLLVAGILFLAGCGTKPGPQAPQEPPAPSPSPPPQAEEEEPPLSEQEKTVTALLQEMTLEERVGQVLMAAFRKDGQGSPVLQMNETILAQLEQVPVGGIILFGENIKTVEQTRALIMAYQEAAELPLFMGVDEEGGTVSRLQAGGIPATRFPQALQVGRANDPELAYELGVILGKELAVLGFNMDFAPVADVNTNPANPVIGNRAFSSEPERAAQMVEQVVQGLQDQQVSSVIKHFPGHGDTSLDSHEGAVQVNHDLERLRAVEWVPFRRGIQAGADGVMIGHIQVPAVIGSELPATFSSELMETYLREELGFEGLIITDALDMGAITQRWSSGEAALLAFQAGADLLLMPLSLEEAYQALLQAVEEGTVTEERLNQSVRRILNVKYERGLFETGPRESADPFEVLGNPAHRQVVEAILKKAAEANEH